LGLYFTLIFDGSAAGAFYLLISSEDRKPNERDDDDDDDDDDDSLFLRCAFAYARVVTPVRSMMIICM
jgi:hypothetical protein